VPKEVHGIDLSLVDERAIKVVQTLADAGFEAYIVGGAVRDLLLGLRPKDFDVASDATPEQVKALFRRAFIIGRRFRIVHVVFGRGRDHEVIEVSTFRAMMDAAAVEQVSGNEKTSRTELQGKSHVVDAEGRVLRDNVWGPQIEDAARRDFTVNAMYYDPRREIVVDYHGGIKDAKKKLLRMIGDPETRYREDPVRIVRVVRFAAKLGFEIEAKTRAPIQTMASLLENVPACMFYRGTAVADPAIRWRASRSCASRACIAACSPSSTWCWTTRTATTAARSSSSSRSPTPTAACSRTRAWRPASCSPACCGTTCSTAGSAPRGRARRHSRRCSRRSTRYSTRASAISPAAASWAPTCARSDDAAAPNGASATRRTHEQPRWAGRLPARACRRRRDRSSAADLEVTSRWRRRRARRALMDNARAACPRRCTLAAVAQPRQRRSGGGAVLARAPERTRPRRFPTAT
jgi:hypothetical protein